jgi:hypothetical protein
MCVNEALVDYLAEKCSLYVSELRYPENFAVILPIVAELPPSRFFAEDWSASLSYLFDEHLRFKTAAIAKEYCMKMLVTKRTNRTIKNKTI